MKNYMNGWRIKNKKYNRTDNCLHHLLVYDKTLFNNILTILANNEDIKNYFKNWFYNA